MSTADELRETYRLANEAYNSELDRLAKESGSREDLEHLLVLEEANDLAAMNYERYLEEHGLDRDADNSLGL